MYTLSLIAAYRIGGYIPIAGIDTEMWNSYWTAHAGIILESIDLLAGGNTRRLSLFALGILPLSVSTGIMLWLRARSHRLRVMSADGERGRRKLVQYRRFMTLFIAIAMSLSLCAYLETFPVDVVVMSEGGLFFLTTFTLTTGAGFLLWLIEQIDDRGMGAGIEIVLMTGILAKANQLFFDFVPSAALDTTSARLVLLIITVIVVALTGLVVVVERSERRIAVQYAKPPAGRRAHTHLALRISPRSLTPWIMAICVSLAISNAAHLAIFNKRPLLLTGLQSGYFGAAVVLMVFVVGASALSVLIIAASFDPKVFAEELRMNAMFIPGIRPGARTAES